MFLRMIAIFLIVSYGWSLFKLCKENPLKKLIGIRIEHNFLAWTWYDVCVICELLCIHMMDGHI